eukprot:6893394-Prymnesium_polylepis.1
MSAWEIKSPSYEVVSCKVTPGKTALLVQQTPLRPWACQIETADPHRFAAKSSLLPTHSHPEALYSHPIQCAPCHSSRRPPQGTRAGTSTPTVPGMPVGHRLAAPSPPPCRSRRLMASFSAVAARKWPACDQPARLGPHHSTAKACRRLPWHTCSALAAAREVLRYL